jgi:hypothetical protein
MLADDARVRGQYTDVDKKNVIEDRQPQPRCIHHTINAIGGVVTAVARTDATVPSVDEYESECDGQDPIQSRQREYGSGDGEEPFP